MEDERYCTVEYVSENTDCPKRTFTMSPKYTVSGNGKSV